MMGLTNEVLAGLSSDNEPPCLSLYQPTHRRHPENQQDPIRFRNLVKELEASLRQSYIDDLLDDLGVLVAKNGGTVLVTRSAEMPSRTGLAAIYRY